MSKGRKSFSIRILFAAEGEEPKKGAAQPGHNLASTCPPFFVFMLFDLASALVEVHRVDGPKCSARLDAPESLGGV
jgi:hypothetical protein